LVNSAQKSGLNLCNLHMDGEKMTERDFELLEILNETKNITKTANKLYVSQSSLSKRIASIEEQLGTTLFVRSRQGIHFTPDGEEVLQATRKATTIFSDLRNNLDLNKNYLCGTLNAGVSINYAQYCLPSLLLQYRRLYPHVKTHIISGHSRNLFFKALDGSVDVAVLRGEFPWKENKILLERENVCAIMSPEFKDLPLDKIPYIGRSTDAAFERELAQWFHENQIQTESDGIFVDNISTCVEMVKSGLGWSIVPDICLSDFHGIIKPLHFANGESFVRSTYLIYSDSALNLPQVAAFIEIVKKYHFSS
jgi:DNA-binding transcriptional LysR family regulator